MKKGFTLIEVIVSFTLVSILSVGIFRTILSLEEKEARDIEYNSYITFSTVLSETIQKDFTINGIKDVTSCGDNCYDITLNNNKVKRFNISDDKLYIVYDGIKEKIPSGYKLFGDMKFNEYISNLEGLNSYVLFELSFTTHSSKNVVPMKFIYQYDSNINTVTTEVE